MTVLAMILAAFLFYALRDGAKADKELKELRERLRFYEPEG